MNKKIRNVVFVLGTFLAVIGVVLFTQNSMAYYQEDKFYKMGFYNCWHNNLKKSFSYSEIEKISNTSDIFESNPKIAGVPTLDKVVTCLDLFTSHAISVPIATSGNVVTFGDKKQFLSSIGYEPVNSGKGATFTFRQYKPDKDGSSGKFVDITETVSVTDIDNKGTIAYGAKVDAQGSHFVKKKNEICFRNPDNSSQNVCESYTNGKTKWDTFIDNLHNKIKKRFEELRCTKENIPKMVKEHGSQNPTGSGGGNVDDETYLRSICFGGLVYESEPDTKADDTYKKAADGVKVAYKRAFGSDLNYPTDVTFSEGEATLLYNDYIKNFYGAERKYCASTRSAAEKNKSDGGSNGDYMDDGSWFLTKLNNGGDSVEYCYVHATTNVGEKVYGINEAQRQDGRYNPSLYENPGRTDFEAIAKWLLDHGADNVDSEDAEAINSGESEGSSEDAAADAKEDPCFKGAGAIGWLLCPVIDAVGGAMNWIYDIVERVFLQLPAQDLFDQSKPVYRAWAVFRDIANVVFVIVFLIIIFSQLTGYGIDNYGIKRMLPRLIVTAILVNLSYIICQLLVDVSNLVGASISDLFNSLVNPMLEGTDLSVSYSPSAIRTGAYVAIIGVGIGLAIFSNPAILISLGIALVSGLISLFFMWMVLIAREVGVVIVVVLAPLAFTCYSLPNLNSIFKKWKDLVQGLLLLYPLCSFLIGGSFFVSVLIGNISFNDETVDAGMKLAAMLVRVLPFFALPTLFRGSLRAMGNIGERLHGWGQQTSRGFNQRANNAEVTRRARTWVGNNAFANARNKVATGNFKNQRVGKFMKGLSVITGNTRNRRADVTAYRKQQNEDRDAQALLTRDMSERIERTRPQEVAESSMADRIRELAKGNDQEAFYAQINEYIRRNGGKKGAETVRQALVAAGDSGLMAKDKRDEMLRTLNERFGQNFGGNDYTLTKYMQMGGRDKYGNATDIGSFEDTVIETGDLSDEQVGQLSAKNIERLVNKGKITKVQAQKVRENPQIFSSMDEVQQTMIGYYATTGNRSDITEQKAEEMVRSNSHNQYIRPEPQKVTIVNSQLSNSSNQPLNNGNQGINNNENDNNQDSNHHNDSSHNNENEQGNNGQGGNVNNQDNNDSQNSEGNI